MLFRTRRSFIVLSLLCLGWLPGRAEETPAEANAEAARLYARANDYVTNITENAYSYAYIQFYWKRAQANLDRVMRVYPKSPTGQQLLTNEVGIGPYELGYYRERVLPRLEEKRIAAYDAVNCAIFLYNRDEARWDDARRAALASILEVLSRQQRWNEALSFPVLDDYKPLLFTTVFRVAARFRQQNLVQELLENATPELKALYLPIQAEAMVFTGVPREDITAFVEENPAPEIRSAVLAAMIEREVAIRRAAILRRDVAKGLQTTHYSLHNLEVRDDIAAAAAALFPAGDPVSREWVSLYQAALGRRPAASAPTAEHLAYLEHLAVTEAFEDMARYMPETRLSTATRQACELKLIELYAQEGRLEEAGRLRSALQSNGGPIADAAGLAEFRGRMVSNEDPLTVRPHSFSELPIEDPLVMAQAIMDWSLTPNRSIRGASPYDSVVRKYLPGFDNLPLPKSQEVQEASAVSKPF